jgi:hypothetical protein
LCDIINASSGVETLGAQLHKSPNSLKRMLSGEGYPRVGELFAVISHLKASEGVSLSVRACADKP